MEDGVVAVFGIDEVVAYAGVDEIVAAAHVDIVVLAAAVDRVGLEGADDDQLLDSLEVDAVKRVRAVEHVAPEIPVEGRAGPEAAGDAGAIVAARIVEPEGVGAGAAEDLIDLRSCGMFESDRRGIDDVVAAVAGKHVGKIGAPEVLDRVAGIADRIAAASNRRGDKADGHRPKRAAVVGPVEAMRRRSWLSAPAPPISVSWPSWPLIEIVAVQALDDIVAEIAGQGVA